MYRIFKIFFILLLTTPAAAWQLQVGGSVGSYAVAPDEIHALDVRASTALNTWVTAQLEFKTFLIDDDIAALPLVGIQCRPPWALAPIASMYVSFGVFRPTVGGARRPFTSLGTHP